ncbi:MAG: hypothetical protein ACJ76S_05905 [Solirubrobacteraceae bacterium]|jgi:hypothetical protein
MRRTIALMMLAGALGVTGSAAAAPPKPQDQNRKITINASPFVLNFASPLILTGELKGPAKAKQTVTLQRDRYPYGDRFENVSSTHTDNDGVYRFNRVADVDANYRVRSGAEHAEVAVRVHSVVGLWTTTVTPRRGQLVRFSGTVAPAHNGRLVRLQRRNGAGAFLTIRTMPLVPTTGNRSFYTGLARVFFSGTYRVVIYYDGEHLTSYSPDRRLVAHR